MTTAKYDASSVRIFDKATLIDYVVDLGDLEDKLLDLFTGHDEQDNATVEPNVREACAALADAYRRGDDTSAYEAYLMVEVSSS